MAMETRGRNRKSNNRTKCKRRPVYLGTRSNIKCPKEVVGRKNNSSQRKINTENYQKQIKDHELHINQLKERELSKLMSKYKKLEKACRDKKKTCKRIQQDKKILEVEVKEIAKKLKVAQDELCEKSKIAKKLGVAQDELCARSKKLKKDLEDKKCLLKVKEHEFGKRPKPLQNIGSTCFMNAILQNLAWTPQLGNALQRQLIDMHGIAAPEEHDMTTHLFNLVCYTHNNNMKYSSFSIPKGILEAARKKNDIFYGNQQQDSFEMFNTIVNGLKEELLLFYRETIGDTVDMLTDSEILRRNGAVRLFSGNFITVYKYTSCCHVETVFQTFTSITVPILKKNDFSETSEQYVEENRRRRRKRKRREDNESSFNCQGYCSNQEVENMNRSVTNKERHCKKKTLGASVYDVSFDWLQEEYAPDTESLETQMYEEEVNKNIKGKEHNVGGGSSDPFETCGCSLSYLTDIENGLFHGLMKVETFSEDIIFCRKCSVPSTSGTCLKKTLIFEPPPVLVLHIDRFKKDCRRGLVKRTDMVSYPMKLDLSPFCSVGLKIYQRDAKSMLSYSLYGVIAHSGTLNSGHYEAFIRTSDRSNKPWHDEIFKKYFNSPDKRKRDIEAFLEGPQILPEKVGNLKTANWFCVGDEYIENCSESNVINNKNAYVLMYEKS